MTTSFTNANEKSLWPIKLLIWLYVFLWIVEGALRKWILPGYSDPLLVVRDPVVLLIYLLAAQHGLLPRTPIVGALMGLAIVTGALTMLAGHGNFSVMLFGLRTNFLHLPLIFLIPKVFTIRDVRRMGWMILAFTIPMAMIMVWQFRSPLDSWANAGAGGKLSAQLSAVGDKARTSGTFTFITGPVAFFAIVMAYLLQSQLQKRSFPLWLAVAAASALPVATAVSGSRSMVAQSAVVVLFGCVGIALNPKLFVRVARLALVVGIVAFIVSGMSIYQEGAANLTERFQGVGAIEGGFTGFLNRFFNSFLNPIHSLLDKSLLGEGIGMGTNAGGAMLGIGGFKLGEDEWDRVFGEMGLVFGPVYALLRVWIFFTLLSASFAAAKRGNLLPMLMLGACGVTLLNGQLGQPTTLGFGCFVGGLCLAAAIPEPVDVPLPSAGSDEKARPATSSNPTEPGPSRRSPPPRPTAPRPQPWRPRPRRPPRPDPETRIQGDTQNPPGLPTGKIHRTAR